MIETNLENVQVVYADRKPISLLKNSRTIVEDISFIVSEFVVKGKIELGELTSTIPFDLEKATNNELHLDLNSEKRALELSLPNELFALIDHKMIVNGKEVANSLTADIQVLSQQELLVHATAQLNGIVYSTNQEKLVVGEKNLKATLTVSSEIQKQIRDSALAQQEKEVAARKLEEIKGNITQFLADYRSAVFGPVASCSNYYVKHYDTTSSAYKEMVEWTTSGVAKAKIDYYRTGAFEVQSVSEENGHYIVQTYEDFTVHYTDKTPDNVSRKTKTYYLKPAGNSFAIYNIEVVED